MRKTAAEIQAEQMVIASAAFVSGFIFVFLLKYGLVGLRSWDAAFHPERLPCDVGGAV